MRKSISKSRKIEFIFPVMIFFVFTLSSLVVILFAAQVYQKTVAGAAMNYNANTTVAYIREKIHQHDNGRIGLAELDGCDAICMRDEINGETYATYIYAYDGQLRELFIRDTAAGNFSAASGQKIIDVESFSVEISDKRLLSFSCRDNTGHEASAIVGVYSGDLFDER